MAGCGGRRPGGGRGPGTARAVVEWIDHRPRRRRPPSGSGVSWPACTGGGARLRRALAGLHRRAADGQRARRDWPSFYASRRVLPFVRLARRPARRDVALVEEAVSGSAEVAGPAEPPAGSTATCGAGTCCGRTGAGRAGRSGRPRRPPGDGPRDAGAVRGAPPQHGSSGPTGRRRRSRTGGAERVPLHQLHPLPSTWCSLGGHIATTCWLPWRGCWPYDPVF